MNADTCLYESMYPTHLVPFFLLVQHFSMARVIGLGVSRKVQNTGEPMPNFFKGLDLVFLGRAVGEGYAFYIREKFSVQFPYHLDIISMSSEGPLKV